MTERALLESDESLIKNMLKQMGLDMKYSELQERGHLLLGDSPFIFFDDLKFDTPSGKIEIDSELAAKLGASGVPTPEVDPPINPGQYRLLTPASSHWMNDSYANDPHLLHIAGVPEVFVHPEDAELLSLKDGEQVELYNETGAIALTCRIDSSTQAGVLLSYKGRWPKLSGGANVNMLHSPRPSDLGESTTVHSTMVGLRKAI